MKNTRTTQGRIKQALKLTAGITMLALLFVIVFAGTLSGAFGVEENLVQNGTIQENVADAMNQNSFSTYNFTYNDFTLTAPSTSGATKNTPNDGGVILMKGNNNNRGAFYAEVELKGDLLNHVKNGATVTVNFSTYQNDKSWDDADNFGVAITSETPYYDSSNDNWGGSHYFLNKSSMDDGTDTRKTATWTLTSSTTKFYVAIFVRADGGMRAEFFDPKIEFTYSYDYTVNFSSANTEQGTVSPASSHITASTGVAETKATSTATPKAGYHFVNWTKGSTTTAHTTNATISIGSTDYFSHKSYTANFAINQITVNYHTNLGSSKRDDESVKFTYSTSGTNYLKSPARLDGYTFVGWATSSTGDVYHQFGANVGNNIGGIDLSLAQNHGKSVDLYAVWIASDFGIISGGSRENGTWGSASNPFAIETAQHLKNLSDIVNNVRQPVDSVTGTYYGNAISTNATDITYTGCYFVVTADINVNSLASFARIANDSSHYFNGNFNGQSHVIYNLSCGLFGYVDGGTFQNLTVRGSVSNVSSDNYGGLIGYATNITVSGVVNEVVLTSSKTNIGGVVGFCQKSTFSNCINNVRVSGAANVGGIVGFTGDTEKVGFGSHINNSTNSGNIVVSGDFAGGIVGWGRDTNYTTCYNTSSINAGGNNVGGITGRVLGGSVVDSHNQATIQGNNYVGGIAGNLSWATITDVSNTGEISGNDYVGGLLGFGECNDKTNLLIKGVLSNTGRVGGNTYVGGIVGSLNNNNAKQPEDVCEIEWTATVQATGGDTIKGVCYVGGAIGYLSQRINISGTIDVNVSEIDREDGGNYCIGGIIGYNAGTISATMTSAGRIIARSSGTFGDKTGAFAGGIVGYNAASGVISSSASRVASSGGGVGDVLDVGDGGYVGGICGYNAGKIGSNKSETIATYTYIESVSSDQNFKVVDGGDNVGGFIGCNEGEIYEYTIIDVNVTVNGNNNVGGLFGYTKDITLSNITHTTSVNGAGSVGGFIGYLLGNATISQCANSGNVTATGANGVAGFVGYMGGGSNLTATNCTNSGAITDASANGVGGVVGYMESGSNIMTISACKNTGTIVGSRNAGGIGGRLETTRNTANSISISNCYNSANVTANEKGTVGGIAGYLFGNQTTVAGVARIMYCYNQGRASTTATSAPNVGGIVGNPRGDASTASVNVSYSYTTNGNVSGTTNATVEGNCYVITTSYQPVSNGGYNFDYEWGTLAPIVMSSGAYTQYSTWEDILTQNINGFKVYGTLPGNGYYIASNLGVLGVDPQYYIIESGANGNAVGSTKQSAVDFSVSYCVSADAKKEMTVLSGTFNQDTSSKTYNAQEQYIEAPNPSLLTSYSYKGFYFVNDAGNAQGGGTDADTYSVVTDVYFGGAVVGRRTYSSWTITKRELSVSSVKWTDNLQDNVIDRSSSAFVYNTGLQGVKSIGFGNVPSGVSASTLFTVTSTNSAPVSIPHAVKEVNDYTVTYTIQDTHNYEFEDGSTSVTFKWTIAKNELTVRIAWTSDKVSDDIDKYNFTFNNSGQGIKLVGIVAQKDTYRDPDTQIIGKRHTVSENAFIIPNSTVLLAKDVGEYRATITLADSYTSNYVIKKVECFVDTIPDDDITTGIVDSNGVSTIPADGTNVVTYSWKINQFDIASAIAGYTGGKAWFGGNSGENGLVVSNQSTVRTDNVGGTEYSYFYLQDTQSADLPILVYENANYTKNNFVLYIKYTTKINGANSESIAQITLDTDFTIDDLTQAGDAHVAKATVTATGRGNFKGEAKKYYTVLNTDFGGRMTEADWGSASNPYVIENPLQLIRLSQIVNGGVAWNSVNSTDKNVALAQNVNAVATSRNYANSYFVVKTSYSGTVAQSTGDAVGFEPIGSATYPFSAVRFAREGDTNISVEYSYNSSTRDYVGLFGYINGTHIYGIDVKGVGKVAGANYVGGIVGYANGGRIEDCSFAVSAASGQQEITGVDNVGGIVGYANATAIIDNDNDTNYATYMSAKVSGTNFVGGLVGYWKVTDGAQVNGTKNMLTYANAFSVAGSGDFAGGIAGVLDANLCTTDLTYLAFYTNGTANGTDNVMDVYGVNYVGALFGAFFGNGYHNSATDSGPRTVLVINEPDDVRANVVANGAGYVMGGLVGYAQGVGILFGCDWENSAVTVSTGTVANKGVYVNTNGKNVSFVGGLVGVMGKNATVESVRQEVSIVGGTVNIAGGQYTVTNKVATKGYNFVGGIFGYISSNAGTYFGTTGTILGNSIALVNNATVNGRSFVGGIAGGLGIVENYSSYVGSDTLDLLKNLLSVTHNTDEGILGYSTLETDPYTANPFGRVINLANVEGSDRYVGGIFGYVGDRVSLTLENAPVSTTTNDGTLDNPSAYLNVFNGNAGTSGSQQVQIKGVSYVGGVAGWLDNQAHNLKYVVNRAVVWGTSTTDSYAGGLVGYMNAGTIENCISVATEQEVSVTTNTYKGSNYVGGLVGYIVGGKIANSISTGFKFSSVGLNAGGVIGNGVSPTIENTWTVYLGQNAKYSTVSGNEYGKYILVDIRIATATGESVPNFVRLERTVGLYTADIASGTLEIIVNVPPRSGRTLNNKQLVFYDASGEDSVTQNAFARFENSNNRLTMGLTMSSADSMIVSIVDATFVNIANYKGTDTYGKNANALKGYRAPSNSTLYTADVVQSTYDTDGRITGVWANLYFFNGTQNVLIGAYQQEDGTINRGDEGYVGNYTPGDASSPYIISTQEEWNEFAYSIYTGQKDYSGKFVKLNTDIVISNGTHKDTNGNTLNFSAEVTPNNNASDPKNSNSNSGYNLAGNIAQGYDGSVYMVTVNGTAGAVTPSFKGTFDGNGHTITINSTNYNHRMSVFPNAGGGSTTFKNLTILGSIKAGTSTSDAAYDVAGFVGKPFGAIRFENCTNAANVQGLRLVAGFTGVSSSSSPITLIGCVNKGNITSYEGSTWNKSGAQTIGYPTDYAYGTGGFIARANANITIESCINMGSVIAPTKVGGLVGRVNGSSSSATTIYIKNCANTGYIEGNEHNPYNTDDKKITANAWARAGGLIGEVDQYTQLYMYASYNTGNVRGQGSIVGGLVGILGTIPDNDKPHSAVSNHTSYIYYCYNTGTVTAGYKPWSGIPMIGTSFYNFNGCNAGGLVGVAVRMEMNYCYNIGDIYSYGGVGYLASWQTRNAGILAEAVTNKDNCKISISNTYNTGTIYLQESTNSETRYSADIIGYMDTGQGSNSTKISVTNCYGVMGNIVNYQSGSPKYYSGFNSQGGGDSNVVRTGTILISRADLTAVMQKNGTVKPESYNSNQQSVSLWNASIASLTNDSTYNSGTASGYIYLQGCLPQLAVFAVDTHNGLSMRSVNYGVDMYGEYKQQAAGQEYSPYVIKDGIDLLGVQALVDLGYNFADKYIEFANASNNITMDTTVSSVVTKRIDMSTSTNTDTRISDSSFKSSSTENGTASQEGKSYHLFKRGAVCYNPGSITLNNSNVDYTNDSSAYTTWLSRNFAYDQSSGTYTKNATYSRSNFLPIGRNNGYNTVFRGNISGKQKDGSNTEVADLRIVSSGSDYAFAGLFARAESANISNITVSGQVYSYATSATGTSMAGGVVANLSGKSVVDGCIAGTSSRRLYVTAYGKNNSYSSTTVDNLTTYAGGIVGVGNTSYQASGSYSYTAGTTGTVKNCNVVNATVQSAKNNIGGIVGFVASSSLTGSVTAKDKNNKFEITDNAVSNATLYALSANGTGNADIGTRVGGIIGYSGQFTSVIISGCTVGTRIDVATDVATVTIKGENALGGIAGAMPDAINEIKDCSVNASTLIQRGNSWGNVENVDNLSVGDGGNHGTAIGGIVGHTYHNTSENAVTLTIGGNVVFAGKINIIYASVDDAVRNVGGIVGDMCSGASFATGAKVNVTGTIDISSSITQTVGNENNSGVRNIGGVAGRTRDVAFSGEFTVSANVSIPNAINVGGFIGRNRGVVNILADDTIITIGGTISGAHDVGGFIGNNSADDNSVLYIGANEYRRTRYERPLSIEISAGARILSTGDNVGGIVGNNFSKDGTGKGSIQIVKGSITNKGSVQGANAVGGIIGNNDANLATGGGTGPYAELTIVNAGQVTGSGNYVGGVIGLLNRGSIAGTFINNGDVTGNLFVGGSIGYVASDATITVAGGVATEFKNGSQDDAISSSDALTADGEAVAQGTGTVIGQAYVGGSIGIMLGSIVGTSGAKVVFTSSGKVDATNVQGYLGGSIGALAGRVSYAQFISAGDKMSGISAVTAVGGSVGLIGLPVGLGGTAHQTIVVDNSHFESNGNLSLTGAKVSEASNGKGEFEWGGVGGAIGVIGGDGQGLDKGYNNDFAGGSNWHDNTYYAQGNVSAPGINNVGGIVGLIRADDIEINNMLAYDITVSGATNVGGIVGATIGSGTVIEYAYSISTTDDKGLFTASAQDGQAGGIIGKALADTDASTSYWVKGYKNAELASTDASKLKDTLGLFTAITEVVNGTTIIFTKELVGGASDAESEESSEEGAIYPRPYDYIDAVGEHAVGGQNVTLDSTCVKDENGNITSYKDWAWYFSTYYTGAEFINDTWVLRKPDWKAYSTGTEQTGWYFVYANDTVSEDIVGTVDALHQSSVGVGSLTDKDFWKRIANAYTKEEIESGEDTALLYSTLASNISGATVSSGGLVQHNNLYATATSARTTKSGYYLYIASSGSSRPTAIHDSAEDKFYIQINTAIDKMTIAKNVAVYYRSFAMGSALTYNGYARYAPISLQKDIPAEPGIAEGKTDTSKKNTYAYTTQLVGDTVAKEARTTSYKSDVSVYYYDDAGKAYRVGGIREGQWKIKQRTLTFNASPVTNKTYGDKDIQTKVTISNVAPTDRDSVTFVINISGKDLSITISDLKPGKSYSANDYQGIEITLVTSVSDGSLSGTDANFNAEPVSDKSTYKIEFSIKFTNAKKYEIDTTLAEGLTKTNYTMSNSSQSVEVKKKKLDIVIGDKSVFFDGNDNHGTTWTLKGIVTGDGYSDTWQTVLRSFSPMFTAKIETATGVYDTFSEDLLNKNSLTANGKTLTYQLNINGGTITFTGAGDVGYYYIAFSNCGQNDVNNTSNYYFALDDNQSESYAISKNMIRINWSGTGSHVYDKSTVGTVVATVTADHAISGFKSFVESYFTSSWSGTTGDTITLSSSNDTVATFTFTTKVNAGTYTAKLQVNKQTNQDKVNCSYIFQNGTNVDDYSTYKYTITKRYFGVAFEYSKGGTNNSYKYDTYAQGLTGVRVTALNGNANSGLISGDTVWLKVVVTGADVLVSSGYGVFNNTIQFGTSTKSLNPNTIDVGTYTVSVELTSSTDYQFTTVYNTWTITQYELSLGGLADGTKVYDGVPFKPQLNINGSPVNGGVMNYGADEITVNYKATSTAGSEFVNVGEYTVSIGGTNAVTAKRGSVDTTPNYKVDGTSSARYTITARTVNLTWETIAQFVYNAKAQGLKLASAYSDGTGSKVALKSGGSITSAQITGYAGGDVIHISISGGKVNVNDTPATMSASIASVSGTNSDGSNSIAENYVLANNMSGEFSIVKSTVSIAYASGSVTKVYDATRNADVSGLNFAVTSSNGGATLSQGSFTISGIYDDKNVGYGTKSIIFTYAFNDTSGNFEFVGNTTQTVANVGTITPKDLVVVLDKLRSGKATKVYSGNTLYGGDGATYSSGTSATSKVYRSGEGFRVTGFPNAESSGAVTIYANYKEADARRSAFDSYVNFVYETDGVYRKGTYTSGLFKTLVFAISGDCAGNYTFKVQDSSENAFSGTIGSSTQNVVVYDSRDDANKDKRPSGASTINIEITVKTYKVNYSNTSQSYANSDNTYNTDWLPVEATNAPDGTQITVLNGWMYENGTSGDKKVYKQYTVIRGRTGSTQLSAQVSGANGMELNYNMSNQPILTIGYFVDSTDFEVGSIASLMIASYYWYASQHADSPDFNPIVSAGSEWTIIVSNDDYVTGSFGENKPKDAPEGCDTWDAYFAFVEQDKNVTVFLNEYEGNTWGYYTTTQSTSNKTYTSYKQTADISGVVTATDIAILDSFFTVYVYNEDGSTSIATKTWGAGGDYITNFIKPSVGNVLTSVGSVFVSTSDGFGGTYNGSGYVIEYLNILGFGGESQNVGLFDKIGTGSVSGLHLRNISISANGGNVGGIAGEILAGEASASVSNVSFHGTVNVNSTSSATVGALFGKSARDIDKAIALGTITASGTNVTAGGAIGNMSGALSNLVSLVQVDSTGTVGAISGNNATATNSFHMQNAVLKRDGSTLTFVNASGQAISYASLMGGSVSGYGASKYYYDGTASANAKGTYDVLDDVAITTMDVTNKSNPRQSMRLRDVVDVYLLMYSLSETTATGTNIGGARVYEISSSSWLVGTKHGTSSSDAIVIANAQNVALLRQLRFATFILDCDVTSDDAQTFDGAFYGSVYQNGHSIAANWLGGMFEKVVDGAIVTA